MIGAEVIFENEEGEMDDIFQDEMPFDINALDRAGGRPEVPAHWTHRLLLPGRGLDLRVRETVCEI